MVVLLSVSVGFVCDFIEFCRCRTLTASSRDTRVFLVHVCRPRSDERRIGPRALTYRATLKPAGGVRSGSIRSGAAPARPTENELEHCRWHWLSTVSDTQPAKRPPNPRARTLCETPVPFLKRIEILHFSQPLTSALQGSRRNFRKLRLLFETVNQHLSRTQLENNRELHGFL